MDSKSSGAWAPSCVIGTAGHIDHGKTSLVKALTGMDTDRLKEEKRRGVSIDLGFACMELGGGLAPLRAAIVDVPGHERFIRNMLAGTTGIDLVLFVVAADDGVMPQTREHFEIVRLLGVGAGVFALTKSDLVSGERLSEVAAAVEGLAKGTAFEGSPVVAVSSVTGAGLVELKALLREMAPGARKRGAEGFFRLPIDRSFTVKGFGAVVTGTVASGSVRKGDELARFPGGERVKVRGIQSLFTAADEAAAGQRAALNLAGLSHLEMRRGDLVVSEALCSLCGGASLERGLQLDCAFEFLRLLAGRQPRGRSRGPFKVHHLTGEALATVRLDGAGSCAEGGKAIGRLTLKGPLLMMRGDRFILRDPAVNATIGGGEVLASYFSRELLPRAGRAGLEAGDGVVNTLLKVLPASSAGCSFFSVSLMLNLPRAALAGELTSSGLFLCSGDFVMVKDALPAARASAAAFLKGFHEAHPLEPGAGEGSVVEGMRAFASAVPADMAGAFIRELLDLFAADGAIRMVQGAWSLPTHSPALAGPDSRVEAALLEIFTSFQPDLEAMGRLPFSKGEIARVLAHLQRRGSIARLREGSFISASALTTAKDKLAAHLMANGAIKASEFRDLIGSGRRLAIEILEYFDRERFTIRGKDDMRRLR